MSSRDFWQTHLSLQRMQFTFWRTNLCERNNRCMWVFNLYQYIFGKIIDKIFLVEQINAIVKLNRYTCNHTNKNIINIKLSIII